MRKPSADTPDDAVNTRGEMTVPLDGQRYVLRPTEQAIATIEEKLGRSQMELWSAALRGALSNREMAVICVEMMRAYGEANPGDPLVADYRGANIERVAKLVFEAGAPSIAARLAVLFAGTVNGGYTAAGEPKPAT